MGRAFQCDVQSGKNLRHDHRRPCALNDARRQQLLDIARHAAQQRGQAKARHAPHKQTTAAEVVPQLAAKGQADGKGHAVKGDNQLQPGGGGVQRVGDGVQRHVGD
ncbi:hypothetical protein D3C76_1279730 [compost metagenome]